MNSYSLLAYMIRHTEAYFSENRLHVKKLFRSTCWLLLYFMLYRKAKKTALSFIYVTVASASSENVRRLNAKCCDE